MKTKGQSGDAKAREAKQMKQPNQMKPRAGEKSPRPSSTLINEIAKRTEDAWCFDRYANWTYCVKRILALGFTERETEAILRSKWMRWAADMHPTAEYGKVPATAIVNALRNPEIILGEREARRFREKLAELVEEAFGEQA